MKAFYLLILFFIAWGNLTAEELPLIKAQTILPRGANKIFGFQTLQADNKTVLLEVTSRSDHERLIGSTAIMTIYVNGHEVNAAKSRSANRLVNKPLFGPVEEKSVGSWFADDAAWRVVYAPDFEKVLKVPFYIGDPYTLVLDITDLINPVAENNIKIVNLIDDGARWKGLEQKYGALVLKTLKIKLKDGKSPMMVPALELKPYINRGEPAAQAPEYQATLLPGGALAMTVGKEQIVFDSSFSYPNAGLNYLKADATPDKKSQKKWKPIVKNNPDGGEILAEGNDYKLSRKIKYLKDKIEISDNFTNLRNENLGIVIYNGFSTKNISAPLIRLAGNADPTVKHYYASGNSSVHLTFGDKSMGMLGEDDLSMNQPALVADENSAGIRNEIFKLNPQETYTLKWAIYPINGSDYFDFINQVRKSWNINYTVDGPYSLFNPEDILATPLETLREQFKRHGIKYIFSNGGWVQGNGQDDQRNGFGTGVFDNIWESHRKRLRQAAQRIRKAAPNVKIWVYFDAMRDSSIGSLNKYRDSAIIDESGDPQVTTWGAPGKNNLCYSYVPTLTNSFGKAMLKAFDRYLEVTSSDGIYVDEMNCCGAFNMQGYTCNQFDGHSALIDQDKYTIKKEIGLIVLLIQDWQWALIEKAKKSCGYLLGNGAARTQKMFDAKVGMMIETQFNDFWGYQGLLSSPLGWTYPARSTFDGTTRTISLGCLPVGVPLSAEHEISRFLFPFTPVELHHGYLLGKERIITLHDGNYGWHNEHALGRLHHFNKDGLLINDAKTATVVNAKEARTKVKLGQGEAMVIERLPLALKSANAEVKNIIYDAQRISLEVTAPAGGVLIIADGDFSLAQAFSVRIGDKEQKKSGGQKNSEIIIPENYSGEINIKRDK